MNSSIQKTERPPSTQLGNVVLGSSLMHLPTRWISLSLTTMLVFLGLARGAEPPPPRVDFSYAFATPHRLTVARPDSSDKTLLDLQPGSLRVAWSYDNLLQYPLGSYKTPPTAWAVKLTPEINSQSFATSRWTRVEGHLPALENLYESPAGSMRIEAVGGASAAILRLQLTNKSDQPQQFSVRCESQHWGENPAWMDPARFAGDNLVAGWNERADRVLMLGLNADRFSVGKDGRPPGPKIMLLVWELKPGETRMAWMVRPYRAYTADLPALRTRDWAKEMEAAKQEWRALLDRASRLTVPDASVANAFRACLADLFIMREPVPGGSIGEVPGTEVYRAANVHEAAVVAIALDQLGFHKEAMRGYEWCLENQEADGNWNEPRNWGHTMWSCSGFKCWAAMEHYRLTRDRQFLARVYPHMAASSRWQGRERARTRITTGVERPLTYGLMPRGFGDCGLMDDSDLYGVFLPHNLWAVYADRSSVEAAEILGRKKDVPELNRIYETAHTDLLQALDRGAIREKDYRWIPGVPGKTSGSRWGALNAFYPCCLLPADHDLITGTLRHIELNMSPGGIPVRTGWMQDGMWVAITLDNVAETHLARGNGDAAARYFYATLNHGTPLFTWCEERGQEPGTTKCTGDRQHLWTPVAVVRCLRDMLVMEDGDGLQLALGTDRSWLASGQPVGIADAPTHFGRVSWQMQYDAAKAQVTGLVEFAKRCDAAWATLRIRLPATLRIASVNAESRATLLPDGSGLRWKSPRGKIVFDAAVQSP